MSTSEETPIDLASGSTNKRSPSPTDTTSAPAKVQRTAAPLGDVPMGNAESQEPELAAADAPAPEQAVEEPATAPDQSLAAPRPRKTGIKPEKLPSLTLRYADDEDDFEPHDGPTPYPHNALLNDKIILWRGDITKLEVDLIVNAANKSLLGGGGVDGAIHSAAGPGLLAECRLLNGAETGEVKLTTGHRLPAKHIAHAVGPIYSSSRVEHSEEKLRSCYRTTLELAVQNELKSVAFCGISTGIYGYPLEAATRTALDEVRQYLEGPSGSSIDKIIFTVFRPIDVDAYVETLPQFFPPPPFPSDETEEKPHRPSGPAPIEIQAAPPSAGAESADLELGSVKNETTTAVSFDEGSSKPIGMPKEVASVKLDSFKEAESVETVVGDLPVDKP